MHELYKNNYLHLPQFITSEEAHLLYEHLERQRVIGSNEAFIASDTQVPNAICSFRNEISLVRLLVREIPKITKILEEPVLPTYVYGRMYQKGDVLTRHRDRPSCQVSLTLNLQRDVEWPIWIETPSGKEVSLDLQPGDAMMYLGCVADHWRDAFIGEKHTQVFLHYVKAHGKYAKYFFDDLTGKERELNELRNSGV